MNIRTNLRRLAVSTVAASALLASVQTPAFAADATDASVISGSLSIPTDPTVSNFGNVTLDGTAETTTATFDNFSVNDARGTGAGWKVTVQATQFAEWDQTLNANAGDYVASGKTLALASLSMAAPTVAKADSTSSAVPSLTAGPHFIDAATAVQIASAAADGTGMGSYTFTQATTPLSLSIPASAYAKVYRSTITVSAVTGP